jgi:signal transduction histidine kinase
MFVQVSPAKHSEDGRGIGLAVVRELVQMHGGTVSASSQGLGLGSEFTVLLPASLYLDLLRS